MREVKRSECAVLHLGMKRHWFRMIESGIKHVEFREAKPYWNTRIQNWVQKMHEGKLPVIEFQCGYGRFSPRMACIAGRGEGVIFKYRGEKWPVEHKELGEFQKARYVLLIGEKVVLK